MKLSIIIPCYNEKKTIEKIVAKIIKIKINKEIIIVDDCSNDGTEKIIKSKFNNKIFKKIFHGKNLGKGASIRSARKYISGDIVIIQDADLEYDPNDIPKLIKPIISSNYKVVYGSRILEKKYFENLKNFSHWIRILGNIFLTIFSNILNNQNLTDAHTCYKVFDSKLFKSINLKEKNFNFCPEITTKISNEKVTIYELPIKYFGRDYSEGKKIQFSDGFKAIFCIIKYKFFK